MHAQGQSFRSRGSNTQNYATNWCSASWTNDTIPTYTQPPEPSRAPALKQCENEEGDSTIWSESESEPESDSASNDSAPMTLPALVAL